MIYWMSERTENVLSLYNVEVIGFDPERSSKSAMCQITHDGEVLVNADSAIKWLKQNRRIFV